MSFATYFKRGLAGVVSLTALLSMAACGPGSSNDASENNEQVSTDVSKGDYELRLWDGSGLKVLDDSLIAAFQKKYPNIKIKATYDPDNMTRTNGPKIISSSDVPDIARITDVASAVKGGHVTDLTPYSKAYGWKLPDFQTRFYSANKNGELAKGDLYSMPVGLSFTGVYWNKELGAKIGMTQAPKTIDEFYSDMDKAKDAGILPVMVNGKDGGTSFIFQSLMMSRYGKDELEQWVLQRDGATFDTEHARKTAEELQAWPGKGYLPNGVNAIDGTTALGRFANGEGLFFFQGGWSVSDLAKTADDHTGFFAFPGETETSPVVGALNATTLGIPAKAKNKNAAAAFLNFVVSKEGREVTAKSSYVPSGTGDLPSVQGGIKSDLFTAYDGILKNGETTNFISDATAGMQQSGLEPNAQQLLDGTMKPADFTKAVQNEYESELGRD